jgi:tellurite methyltransferase
MGESWGRYFDATGDQPRETLLFALERFESEGRSNGDERFAIDLGCGAGRDTAELLRRGWRVLAVDAEEEAIERLSRRDDFVSDEAGRLETQVARFEEARLPSASLINSSFALPFCPPAEFEAVWQRIVVSLWRGGRFSGQLFGDRDGWVPAPDMSFQTREEAEELLRGFDVERFDEIEEDGQTAVGDPKHWHLFHVVARKR